MFHSTVESLDVSDNELCLRSTRAIAASLLAVSGARLVLDQSAAPIPELDAVLDGQRWAADDGIAANNCE